MADLVSPGILIQETDLTTVVPPVGGASAGIVIAAEWGPSDEAITVTSETDLVEVFGKPLSGASTDWLVSSNYLSYASNLQVGRAIDTNALNSSDGIENATGATAAGGSDLNATTAFGDLTGADIVVKVGVTTDANVTGSPKIDYNVTNGIITGTPTIDTAAFAGADASSIHYLFVPGGDGNAIIKVNCTNVDVAATITLIYGGTGYPDTGGGGQSLVVPTYSADVDITNYTLVATGNVLTSVTGLSGLPAGTNDGDYFVVVLAGSNATINFAAFQISGSGGGTLVKNTSDWTTKLEGGYTANTWVARYPGIKGDNIKVGILGSGGTLAGFVDGTIDLGSNFTYAPVTTDYTTARGGSNDEVHVIVYDGTGLLTGKIGTVLEKFVGLSLGTDAKDTFGASNYIIDVLYNQSKWIYCTGDWSSISSTANASNWESKTVTDTDFTLAATALGATHKTIQLSGGSDGTVPSSGIRASLYSTLWEDSETSDISFLIGGTGATVSSNQTSTNDIIASTLYDIVEGRKDCIGFVSPPKSTRGKDLTSAAVTGADKATAVSEYQTLNSSYMVVDSGWKKVYNRYTDGYESIPLCGDTAGLTALTEQTNDAWWSPAGYNRGNVRNVYELYFNPNQAGRDKLYKAGVNPVVSFPGQGVVLFGDKTTQTKSSAFDRINVRRLFIHVEKAVSTAAKSMMFEFNDEFTRSQFRNMVEPFLRDVKARRGIFDYKVVCDSSNNTSAVIDRNEFVGDIYIKPARSINFIRLNFVAVRTGVDFSEVAG